MKKKWLSWVIIIIFAFGGIIYVLNIKVTTRQGINYQWQTIEIPLYLKTLDFFDRHYNYKWTIERITANLKTEEEKVLQIFKWTHENIKKVPEGYPIVDDHVWHIIIRGYGEDEQFSDVFTTLCNYAGMNAFFTLVYTEDRGSRMPLSFVNIEGRWSVFDPYNGVYFKNKKGQQASIEEIIKGDWLIESGNTIKKLYIDYTIYFKNLSPIREIGLQRANIQSPFKRLQYGIQKWIRKL